MLTYRVSAACAIIIFLAGAARGQGTDDAIATRFSELLSAADFRTSVAAIASRNVTFMSVEKRDDDYYFLYNAERVAELLQEEDGALVVDFFILHEIAHLIYGHVEGASPSAYSDGRELDCDWFASYTVRALELAPARALQLALASNADLLGPRERSEIRMQQLLRGYNAYETVRTNAAIIFAALSECRTSESGQVCAALAEGPTPRGIAMSAYLGFIVFDDAQLVHFLDRDSNRVFATDSSGKVKNVGRYSRSDDRDFPLHYYLFGFGKIEIDKHNVVYAPSDRWIIIADRRRVGRFYAQE